MNMAGLKTEVLEPGKFSNCTCPLSFCFFSRQKVLLEKYFGTSGSIFSCSPVYPQHCAGYIRELSGKLMRAALCPLVSQRH
jgi:hypothetical protein